jgi:hypothetical protein
MSGRSMLGNLEMHISIATRLPDKQTSSTGSEQPGSNTHGSSSAVVAAA